MAENDKPPPAESIVEPFFRETAHPSRTAGSGYST